jgi:hypothetical protein
MVHTVALVVSRRVASTLDGRQAETRSPRVVRCSCGTGSFPEVPRSAVMFASTEGSDVADHQGEVRKAPQPKPWQHSPAVQQWRNNVVTAGEMRLSIAAR